MSGKMKQRDVVMEHGDLSIDNNLSERTLRAQSIGRKNRLCVGSDNGNRTVLYDSQLQTARY